LYVSIQMEEGESSNDSMSSASENLPNEDIASPDPVEDSALPESSETCFKDDERSQTPLQDEVLGANEQVAEITDSIEEVSVPQTLQQTSQQDAANVDSSSRRDDEVLKQTVRDDHGELDYDEEVQLDGAAAVTANADSPPVTHQKAVNEEEKENGEEKVDYCFC